jgi:nucleotide-binding universal stress UspA family protein
MDTIVVGYDGSDAAGRALDRAVELAGPLSARLVVVSVSRPVPTQVTAPVLDPDRALLLPGTGVGPMPAVGPPASTDLERERNPEPAELAERALEQARADLAGTGVDADFVAEVGEPAERLLAVAEHRGADLIVVGAREHGFLERLLSRPVGQEVARHAERDVLLVH